MILSNHVPELPSIVRHLGLDSLVTECISSANEGYEKPNPAMFSLALDRVGRPETVWMVGDSVVADYKGARDVGIAAVHVRKGPVEGVEPYSPDLHGVVVIVEGSTRSPR